VTPRKRRVAARAARRARAPLRPAAIDKARDEAIVAIARQRARDGDEANALLDKAHLLLTRHWAKASWAARAKLVENAGWLIQVAAKPEAARRGKAAAR
jgi:hypothetical protein